MEAHLKALVIAIVAIFAPIQALMATVGVLVIADTILGVMAARKRGEKITSSAMRRTVSKAVIYQVAIISGFLCEKYLSGDLIPITKIIGGVIGMVEMKSILENADEINGSPIFKTIIEKLGSKNDITSPPLPPKKDDKDENK